MQFTSTIIYTLLGLAPLAAQADLELNEDDYSQSCQAVCRPIHDLTDICDVDGDQVGGQPTEDRLKLQCICTNDSFDIGSVAPLCQSCMQQNPRDEDDDDDNDSDDKMEDINEIVSRCGFSAATYTPDQASSASSIVVNAARPTAASQLTTTITGGGQSTATSQVTSTATGTTSGATTGTTSGTTTETTGTGTSATSSGAAATSTGVSVSGASHLGSHPGGVGALLLTCVVGAAGLGAWVI